MLGAVDLGNITAGLGNPQVLPDDGFSVGMSSATSITVGDVTGAHGLALPPWGPLTPATSTPATCSWRWSAAMHHWLDHDRAGGHASIWPMHRCSIAAGGGEDQFRLYAGRRRSIRWRPAARSPSAARFRPACSSAAAGTGLTTQAITAQDDRGQRRRDRDAQWHLVARLDVDLASNDIDIARRAGSSGS